MKRLSLVLLLALLWGNAILLRAQTEASSLPSPVDARCKQWVDSVLAGLNLQDRVGQLIVAKLPAKADNATKKLVRDLAKRYKVGGMMFAGGTPEEQAILTNLAQKSSKVPVLVTSDDDWQLSARLDGTPRFPQNAALACIEDNSLLSEYGRELAREYRELGMYASIVTDAENLLNPKLSSSSFSDDPLRAADKMAALTAGLENGGMPRISAEAAAWLLAEADRVVVKYNIPETVAGLLDDLKTGKLSEQEVDARCRKVLSYKYVAGLRKAGMQMQISGISYRIRTEEAEALAARMRRAAVTVLGNHFGVLPLAPIDNKPIALLSVGEGADSLFVEAVRKHSSVGIDRLRLTKEMPADARRELAAKLADYRRIVISISGDELDVLSYADFLDGFRPKAPLVYTFFTSSRGMQMVAPALTKATAVVLAHSADADVQQQVADVLFAKAPAQGKLSMNIGYTYRAGQGTVVTPGMKPGRIIPEDLGMNSNELCRIDDIVKAGLDSMAYPGCQVLVLKDGQPVYDRCFGVHSPKDTTAVRPTDMFDLSNLTTTTATLLAVMKLCDEGKLKLTDYASKYLPALRTSDKKSVTIRDLLLHEAGLPPYIRFYLDAIDPNSVHGPYAQSWIDEWHHTQISEHSYFCSDFRFKRGLMSEKETPVYTLHVADGMWLNKSFKSTILQKIARCDAEGKRYVYSDLGFILLQQVVEAIVQLPMDLYIAKEFYAPMGLQRTMYLPLRRYTKAEVMPTAANDFLRRQDLCGYVHDETAACMGGLSGNAGLFSTATEMGKIYQMLLNGGEWNGKRYLSEATCRQFTTETSAISRRGLGFDKPKLKDLKNSPCAPSAPAAVYGQAGFSGTCAWADPENGLVFVFLSNHICPNVWSTKLGDMNIRRDIQEVIYESLK